MTRSPALTRIAAVLTSIPALAVLIALVTWPGYFIRPYSGIDPSWETAISLAAQQGMDFGTELVFTYGPLGFLFVPSTVSSVHAVLGGIFLVAVRIALAAAVLWAARRSFSLPIAVAIAFVTSALVQQDPLVVIVFIVAAVAISEDPPSFTRPLLVYGGGALSAAAVLGKLTVGVIVLGFCVIGVAGIEGRRISNLTRLAGTFLVTVLALWLVTGQPLGALPDYVRSSNEVVSGYAAAMMLEEPAAGWDWVFTAVAVAAAVTAVVVMSRSWPIPRRIAAVVLVALLAFTTFKQGFVRHDFGHMRVLVPILLAPWVAFAWHGRTRLAAAAAILVIVVAYFPLTDDTVDRVADPIQNAEQARDDVGALLIPSERRATLAAAREETLQEYQVDDATLEAVGDEPVAVYPWETAMVWAYDLNWRPLPVFQSYTAYTHHLDELNADAMRAPDGPQRVLRHAPNGLSIDGRYQPYEAPDTSLAMLCNFRTLRTTAAYQVLGRVPDRCGELRPLEAVAAPYGQWVRVPRPPSRDEAVVAVIDGLEPTNRERLLTMLYRDLEHQVVFDDNRQWRLLPDTAQGQPLLLAAPKGSDFPEPFDLAPDLRVVKFLKEEGFTGDLPPLTIEFMALPVEPAPAGDVKTRIGTDVPILDDG